MKKFIAALCLIGFSIVATSGNTSDVYICVSKTASKYHFSKDCRGLSNCTHTIEKVSLSKAKELGYKQLCGWED